MYYSDCQCICDVAKEFNLNLTLEQAEDVWSTWSDTVAAGWLIVDDLDEVRSAIRSYYNL